MAKAKTEQENIQDLVQENVPGPEKKSDQKPEPADDGKVTVKLFKDNGKYSDDVVVAVNGHRLQIKRGVEVRIPRAHAKVLANVMKQRNEAFDYMDGLASDFKRQSEALKI